MLLFRPVSLFACALCLMSCGGAPAEPSTPAGEPESPASPATPAEEPAAESPPAPVGGVAWADMNRDQRIAYMKTTVLPEMTKTFQAFDAKQFEKVTCVTCHGEGAKKKEFDMPTAALPKLNPAGSFEKHMKAEPEMTKFMMQKVAPQMAGLLGTEPYDPATQKGFGCFGCHTQEK